MQLSGYRQRLGREQHFNIVVTLANKQVRSKGGKHPCKEQMLVTLGVVQERGGYMFPREELRQQKQQLPIVDFVFKLVAVMN